MIRVEDVSRILKTDLEKRPPVVRTWILAVAVAALVVALGIMGARCFDHESYPAPAGTMHTNGH